MAAPCRTGRAPGTPSRTSPGPDPRRPRPAAPLASAPSRPAVRIAGPGPGRLAGRPTGTRGRGRRPRRRSRPRGPVAATRPSVPEFHGGAHYVRGQEGVKNRGRNGFRPLLERVRYALATGFPTRFRPAHERCGTHFSGELTH